MPAVTPTVPRALATRAVRGTLHAGYVVFVVISSVLTSVAVLLGIGLDRISAVRS
ncbi:hypothetical protein RWH43_16875 [Microbacterium sp. KSW2-21]|uniref:MFS transporter n=1 Tax=Microbacterium algihabitans TaxID=3075992 RepID=A0ABU3S051_9MICO|nr:hypothetical protein [Microbacterium sp. KSW2-21]MDU0328435.1 hypothetical protein [Microbacterium sp. KSW2-21]